LVAEDQLRHSLKQSLIDSPAQGFERYAKGSIVMCNACGLPLYKLEHGIALGDKGGQSAASFKPLSAADLQTLEDRDDVDAGIRARLKMLTAAERETILQKTAAPKTGTPMLCSVCNGCFVQVLSLEKSEVLDRAYVIELMTIPPQGHRQVALKGKRLGAGKDWIHEGAKVIH
jgi:hypothetical protein